MGIKKLILLLIAIFVAPLLADTTSPSGAFKLRSNLKNELHISGSRIMQGDINMGGFDIVDGGQANFSHGKFTTIDVNTIDVNGITFPSFTPGSVLFIDSSNAIDEDNLFFFWDDANKRLGIGVADPDTTLEVLSATTQLKLSFDATNYITFAVQSDGDLTLDSNKTGYTLDFGDGLLTTTGTITGRLRPPGGTTVAGTTPLKFEIGPLTTTPEIGAMEFSGLNLRFSVATDERYYIVLSDAPGSGRIPYYEFEGETEQHLTTDAGFTFDGTGVTVPRLIDSELTATRMVFVGTDGLLDDSASITTANGSLLTAGSFSTNGSITAIGSIRGSFIATDLGLEGTPSHTFITDTDTGMWSSGDNILNFSTAATERLEIEADGDFNFFDNDLLTSGTLGAGVITGTSFITGGDIGIAADTDILQLSSGLLTVNSNINIIKAEPTLTLDGSANSRIVIDKGAARFQANIDWKIAGVVKFVAGLTDSDLIGSGDDYFIGRSVVVPDFLIDQSGNVGIGTASPDTKLQVVGGFKVGDDNTNYTAFSATGSITQAGSAVASFNATTITGDLNVAGSIFAIKDVDYTGLKVGESTTKRGAMNWRNTLERLEFNTYNNNYPIDFAGSYETFSPGGNEKMRLLANGNFGINTTSADTKLQVVGDAKFGDDNTNYTSFSATGVLTMAGTARVLINIDLEPALATRPIANPPSEGIEAGFATHDFSPTTDESVYFHLELNHDYADAGTVHIHFDFFVDTAEAGATSVVWGIEYQKQSIGDNFDFTATTTAYTQTSVTLGTPANDKKVHQSSEISLTTTGFVAGDYILLRLFRDADGTGGTDDFPRDTRVIDYHIEYLSDKSGEAT